MLVAAPTGAGKTVVGEFAAWIALRGRGKTFYTTPIKALSNQKYGDFLALHGASNVGLLTGDNSINGGAPIVVMTTEVLRNMVYDDSPELQGLHYVVLDEIHYLQDPYRGAVWEEVLIHLPVDVQTVSLSATVSNAEEFGEWLQTLRGRTEVIIEEQRPVELKHWYLTSDELMPMFVAKDGKMVANPRARELERRRTRTPSHVREGRPPRGDRTRAPARSDVIERLHEEKMLPAIYFIFSRRGCEDAVRQCVRANLRLTNSEERQRILEYADLRLADLSTDELAILGYDEWMAGLTRGFAAHHAGMIPLFKETVEELFARGLLKAVFATETLALGINMPARTVVLESLVKFTGEKHELMTPGEYTQLAGRAGRRGIDELGHCVVLRQRFTRFDAITQLASTRTYPLVSSFRPSYNMAVNLVRNYDRAEAEHLVNSSFAQFQADRDVVKLERTREGLEAYRASYRDKAACELGDVTEYRRLAARLEKMEEGAAGRRTRNRMARVAEGMGRLRPGDVVVLTGGKRRGRYVVLAVTRSEGNRQARVLALNERRSTTRLTPNDFRDPPRPLARLTLPDGFDARSPYARKRLVSRLAEIDGAARPRDEQDEGRVLEERHALMKQVESHPVSKCPELSRHLHFAEREERLSKEISTIDRRIGRRTATLARRFEKVLGVLEQLGYVDGWALTDKGEDLARVYNESDLLVVEALERELLEPLEARELAALCSALVYEARGPEPSAPATMPTRASREAWAKVMRLFRRIRREEEARGLELTREPDPGFAQRAYLWASGEPLDEALGADDAPGDFVRLTKQLVDLLRQLEEIAPTETLAASVGEAVESLHRGVVSYSSLVP